ncbi:dynein axonemal light chain 1 [Stomoxys calcitrans]|uniref:Dynein axonemal light chain 1 n=1 Tax=Stomoxys calcitrans TaxID=35570 RepID=A0A1I8P7Z1_STOCA|nr:dynein axonemal light chain 1 [Stomoxys calcitrans]XP_013114458.1 dynein axonemal light chain 1 [Stomoxys calcitrans]
MSKATTIKEALKRWEDREHQNATQATVIELQFQWPPIEKMDATLGTLVNCERLSLSTNMIEKIFGLNGMKCLRVLSLSRNYIKAISGLEAVADTLEELWLSYNLIEKIKGLSPLKKLKVLYLSNNLIKDWAEFNRFQELEALEDLVVVGNPISEGMDEPTWRAECIKRLPTIKKLDGEPVVLNEEPTL